MKKNNKKGFVLAETIAVSVIIMTSLVIVYTQFATLNNSYKTSFQYNNVNNLYLVNNLRNFIKDDGLDKLIQLLDNNEYVDITSCPSYLFDEYLYCRLLVDNSNMKTILFTKEDISELKNSIDSTNYSQTMKNYIKKINNSTENSQRLIVEFEDETYATILFVFNEEDNFAMAPVEFDYTGDEQSFTVPHSGYYKLEAWGAQGGNVNSYTGGYGGYSTGIIYLDESDILYINVGGQGTGATTQGVSLTGGYNGGGSVVGNNSVSHICASGGGATHISSTSGMLKDLNSNVSSILIVSGGGGGARNQSNHVAAARWGYGGSGGGISGVGAISSYGSTSSFTTVDSLAGNQTTGYSFGLGQTATGQSAGGGGFYGGYSGGLSENYTGSGSGGSGYIGNSLLKQKSMYCYNCNTSNDVSTLTYSTTNVSETPISQYAKIGNGYAKITYVGQKI